MKTKAQKAKAVEDHVAELRVSETAIVTDFTGMTANELNSFRKALRAIGGGFTVVKKRLLKLVFEKEGMTFDPKQFAGQTGVAYAPKDLVDTANTVYKFGKGKETFHILGGFNLKEKTFVSAEDVMRYGQIPGREALLGQLAFLFTVPLKKLLFVMDQKSKQ